MSDFIDSSALEQFPELLRREPESIFRRYIDAHDEALDEFEDDIVAVVLSRQINEASGDELDELGKLFGELGRRRGRTDGEYRTYLKSIVDSFNGRGTVGGIRFAVSSGLDVDVSSVSVEEHFDDIEYTIQLTDWSSHNLETIVRLADLADASVSRLRRIDYTIDTDTVAVSDSTLIQPKATAPPDIVDTADSVNVQQPTALSEAAVTADSIDPDAAEKFDEQVSVSDDIESTPYPKNDYVWGGSEAYWSFAEWVGEIALEFAPTEVVDVADTIDAEIDVTVDTDTATVADTVTVDVKFLLSWDTQRWDDSVWQ